MERGLRSKAHHEIIKQESCGGSIIMENGENRNNNRHNKYYYLCKPWKQRKSYFVLAQKQLVVLSFCGNKCMLQTIFL